MFSLTKMKHKKKNNFSHDITEKKTLHRYKIVTRVYDFIVRFRLF